MRTNLYEHFTDWCQIPIPFKMILAIAKLAKYIVPLMHPDNLTMLHKGNYADVTPLKEFLGRMPLDIETGWQKL